ncbi:MAG: Rieske (2Fe-2S) iron-sulfur domain [Humibacillus sp.]|nr:Rieske (2Fe-2S) iron-sulfur domain [Humibacillus sp.]
MTEPTPSPRTDGFDTDRPATTSERVAALTGRRGVLKVAGVVVGAGALAACSSPPVPSAASPSSSAAASATSDAASATPSATSGDASSSAATSKAAAGGTPTSEIPVGGGKVFADTKTVVTQPTAGTFKAFDAVCPHQGCTVGSVQSNQIVCPCHQSHFDATTGDRVSGPAPTGLTPKKITVSGDSFTVA